MTAQNGKPTTEAVKAKRGDLVVIHARNTRSDLGSAAGSLTTDRFTVGIVTNITRDGMVKGYKEVGYGGSLYQLKIDLKSPRLRDRPTGFVALNVMSQERIDVQAAIEAATENRWSVGGTKGKPFDSLEALKAALRPCARTTGA